VNPKTEVISQEETESESFAASGAPASGTARCGLFHHHAVLEAGAPLSESRSFLR
jgi:hypothetical protein